MSLIKLIEHFAHIEELPIEIDEIRGAILDLGIQDGIKIAGRSADPAKVWGAFYQYTTHAAVYAQPDFHTLIVYNEKLPIPWQRVVCCKELVHIFDRAEERTSSVEAVAALTAKLLGPMSSDDFGYDDIMALKDKTALYECLPLLFPQAAREKARLAIEEGRHTIKSISESASLPVPFVDLILSDAWPSLIASFLTD
ncbi:hypothetical protein [Hyphomicrobium sp.]|jgi:hypothetical protein|uniref:hypothetical protein n=1 Tax=Hyphomicrobium sp. TaxID=82 RepID=UPI00356A864D